MFPKALVLQLDYHKTLPCPKVSAQDSHYSRKLRTNLLGIYCANEETIHCFLYDDSIGGAGPNEVISLLNNLLDKMETKYGRFDQLTIWCDNSPGQLKECFLFFLPRLPGEKGTVSENRSQVSLRRTFVLDMRQAIWLHSKVLRLH